MRRRYIGLYNLVVLHNVPPCRGLSRLLSLSRNLKYIYHNINNLSIHGLLFFVLNFSRYHLPNCLYNLKKYNFKNRLMRETFFVSQLSKLTKSYFLLSISLYFSIFCGCPINEFPYRYQFLLFSLMLTSELKFLAAYVPSVSYSLNPASSAGLIKSIIF